MKENIFEEPRLQLVLPAEEEEEEEEERGAGWYHSFTNLSFWRGKKTLDVFVKKKKNFRRLWQLQKKFRIFAKCYIRAERDHFYKNCIQNFCKKYLNMKYLH